MKANYVSERLLTAEDLRARLQKANENEKKDVSRIETEYQVELAKAIKRRRRTIKKIFEKDWAPRILHAAHNIRRRGEKDTTYSIQIATTSRSNEVLDVKDEALIICGVDLLNKIGYKARRVVNSHGFKHSVHVYIEVDWSK